MKQKRGKILEKMSKVKDGDHYQYTGYPSWAVLQYKFTVS